MRKQMRTHTETRSKDGIEGYILEGARLCSFQVERSEQSGVIDIFVTTGRNVMIDNNYHVTMSKSAAVLAFSTLLAPLPDRALASRESEASSPSARCLVSTAMQFSAPKRDCFGFFASKIATGLGE